MKTTVKYVYIITSFIFLFYLSLPNFDFPKKPEDALRSYEPADSEDPQRRAYFTDLDRNEVMKFYLNQIQAEPLIGLVLPTYMLNYPPEESKTIIRDQTRSTFLEEIVHPFRESLFINGFEPLEAKDAILINEKIWRQKIIIKHVESNPVVRLIFGLMTVILIPVVFGNFISAYSDLRKEIPKIWIFR